MKYAIAYHIAWKQIS